jgi:atypical dual specificity phosphatase
MDEIVPGVFIGPKESALISNLHTANIAAVVSIGCTDPREEDQALESREKLHYLCFPHILDAPESIILHIFARTTAFIAAHLGEGRSVLVHCIYGQSRSATVIAAYLLSIGYSLTESLTHLKAKHDHMCVNPGFLAQVTTILYISWLFTLLLLILAIIL